MDAFVINDAPPPMQRYKSQQLTVDTSGDLLQPPTTPERTSLPSSPYPAAELLQTIPTDPTKWVMQFDVKRFQLHELEIRTSRYDKVLVRGEHAEKDEDGVVHIRDQFTSTHDVPKTVDPTTVRADVALGILTVEAPLNPKPAQDLLIKIVEG